MMILIVTVLIPKCSVMGRTMNMLVTKTYLLMTGAYGAELEEKFFTDAEKTNFKDALKYVTRLVWNGENIASASPSLFVLFLTCS